MRADDDCNHDNKFKLDAVARATKLQVIFVVVD